MGRIIAIDYGTKRVGLAVTDPMQIIATNLTTVHSKDLFSFLEDYLNKEVVDSFVIGYPKDLMNRDTDATKHIDVLLKQLNKRFPSVKVELIDERFTSKIAMQTLVDSGVKKQKRQNKELLDSISATLILQTYMSSIKK